MAKPHDTHPLALVRAKMQFASKLMALSQISRRFLAASSAASNKKKVISSAKKPNGKTAAQSHGAAKQPVHDISKMPQPHPVLTPLNRNNKNNNLISESIPSIESFMDAPATAVIGYKIEIDAELQKRLPRNVSEVSTHFGGNYFILRPELLKSIAAAMRESDKIILDGPNGAGKSIALMQLFASFKESIRNDEKKICLYAPNVHKWTTGYFAYYPLETAATSSFVQPELALEILKLLVICNKGKPALIGLEGEIGEAQLDAYNRAIPLYQKTLNGLLERGIELTMFLDGVNGLVDVNSSTAYLDQEGKQLPLSSLPLCSQIYSMEGGVRVVGAMTRSNPALPSDSSIPASLKQLSVQNYCPEEFKRVLQLYSQLGHCSANNTDQFLAFKTFVSGSNGKKLFKTCEYDSIYYKN